MDTAVQGKRRITLGEIEQRFVDPKIIRKMVLGYFERASNPSPPVDNHVLTISCVDSRLPPARVLGHEHGQAYAIQTVANVVPQFDPNKPYDEQNIEIAAALEYAVGHKGVNEIIIMGHTDCGGAEARLLGNTSLPNVNGWMNHVCPSSHVHTSGSITAAMLKAEYLKAYEDMRRASEKECLSTSLNNVKRMPFIREAIAKTQLSLAAIICDMQHGRLDISYGNNSALNAIADLMDRFKHFKNEAWGENGYMHELVTNGQHPEALIVTGISPYVAPETVFGMQPGDTFIHRRIGGHYHHERTPGGLAATIEFAVKAKEVPSLIYVGHKNDVNRDYALGTMDQYDLTRGFMEKCVPDILQWRESGMHPDKMHEKSMKTTHFSTLKHEAVRDAVKDGKLTVAAILVDHERQTMEFYDPQTDEFMEVEPPRI